MIINDIAIVIAIIAGVICWKKKKCFNLNFLTIFIKFIYFLPSVGIVMTIGEISISSGTGLNFLFGGLSKSCIKPQENTNDDNE